MRNIEVASHDDWLRGLKLVDEHPALPQKQDQSQRKQGCSFRSIPPHSVTQAMQASPELLVPVLYPVRETFQVCASIGDVDIDHTAAFETV